jgi:formate hydrogenlyase transcriptional activator
MHQSQMTKRIDIENASAYESARQSVHLVPDAALSLAAVSAENLQDIQDVIRNHIQHIIGFDELYINLVNHAKQTHSIYIHYSRHIKKADENFTSVKKISSPISDGFFDIVLDADSPIIWDLEEVSSWNKVPQSVVCFSARDTNKFVGAALVNGDDRIGAIFFGFMESHTLSENAVALIQEVAKYLSVAIGNIIEKENLSKTIRDKDEMIALSAKIARIKDWNALEEVIVQTKKKLFGFNDMMIWLIDQSHNTQKLYITQVEKERNVYSGLIELGQCPTGDGIINEIIAADGPLVCSSSDFMKQVPTYISLYLSNNMKRIAGFPVYGDKRQVGALFFISDDEYSFQDNDLIKVKSTALQLSTAVINIVAIEEVKKIAEEKNLLLSLSKSLLRVRTRIQFEQELKDRFAAFEFFDQAILFYVRKAGCLANQPVMIRQGRNAMFQTKWLRLDAVNFTAHDPLVETLVQQGRAIDFELDGVFDIPELHEYIAYWIERGIKRIVSVPLFNGPEILGILFFLNHSPAPFLKRYLSLINGAADQLGSVIAGVIANEKMINRLEESNKYKLKPQIENDYLQDESIATDGFHNIIGVSDSMKNVYQLVEQVADSSSTVLILGETGTGKELIAQALHNASSRKNKALVKVNCATLPSNLIESELFGHERGSFTGATERRIGKFELANNGTLFLDEIGELPFELQVKLLRALQEKEIERVGGKDTIKINVRIIAATNRDIKKEVDSGNFRSDLYFRLNVFPITIPPLRDRKNDIPLLAAYFLIKHAKKRSSGPSSFSSKAMKQMIAYNWPGNVRELEHLIERNILLTSGKVIHQVYLPDFDGSDTPEMLNNQGVKTIDEIEKEYILSILRMTNGKVSGVGGAAELLKIPSTTLSSKMRRLKIKKGPS